LGGKQKKKKKKISFRPGEQHGGGEKKTITKKSFPFTASTVPNWNNVAIVLGASFRRPPQPGGPPGGTSYPGDAKKKKKPLGYTPPV